MNSLGFSNSCFSTFDRKLSPSNSLCSFLVSSALVFLTGFLDLTTCVMSLAVDSDSLDSEDKENNNYNINGTFVNDKK